ncbi:MAG: GspH/FimT family pseudopilin [Proteobacteria bacterium]|nr:GspH/FimT family pseudopilin [Pseudomonadota bacterium]
MKLDKATKSNQRGLTFIELMVVLAIIAILMAYGIPSYREFSTRQNLSSQANDLIGDLNFARQYAFNNATTVNVTPNTAGEWTDGWSITFVDAIGGNIVVRAKQQHSPDVNYTILGANDISFDILGSAPASGVITISRAPDYINFIQVTVMPSGMITSSRSL